MQTQLKGMLLQDQNQKKAPEEIALEVNKKMAKKRQKESKKKKLKF